MPYIFRLQFLCKQAVAIQKNVKNIAKSSYKGVKLKISYFTRKRLNGIYKDVTTDQSKSSNATLIVCILAKHTRDFILEETNMFQNP